MSMFIYSNEIPNSSSKWYGADSIENYQKNKTHYPNWKWDENSITYKFNEYGYRSKPIAEIDWDNYMLSLGCSCTMGMGIPEELTWSSLVSSTLKMDNINLGKTGSSSDFAHAGFIHCIDKLPKLPKLVVVAWPPIFRFLWFKKKTQPTMAVFHFKMVPEGHEIPDYCKQEHDLSMQFATLDELDYHLITHWSYMRKSIKLICESKGIPYIDFSFFTDYASEGLFHATVNYDNLSNDYLWNEIRARDYCHNTKYHGHPGPKHQEVASNYVLSCIK